MSRGAGVKRSFTFGVLVCVVCVCVQMLMCVSEFSASEKKDCVRSTRGSRAEGGLWPWGLD